MDYPHVHEERVHLESLDHDPFIDGLGRPPEQPRVAVAPRTDVWPHKASPERAMRRARRLTARLRGH